MRIDEEKWIGMNLVLIGFMGSGKTSVGKLLSRSLSMPLIDTDSLVEERLGLTIPEAFSRLGEERFREEESRVIEEVAAGDGQIISCGGGAVLRADNLERLKRNGKVFYLRISAEEACRRLDERDDRPLLAQGEDRLERAQRLLQAREPLYMEAADEVIDAEGKAPEELTDEVARLWKGSG